MENILIARAGGRLRAYPLHTHIRVVCHLGAADLRYVTDDGWAGLHLDGDADPRRVDEVYLAHCRPLTGGNALVGLVDSLDAPGASSAVAA